MKIGLYLISAHIVVITSGLKIYYFECHPEEYEDLTVCLLPANISTKLANIKDMLLRLPKNLPYSTKYLEIHGYVKNDTSFETRVRIQIDDIDMFKRTPSLTFLTILARKLEILKELCPLPYQMKLLKQELFNLKHLKNLLISTPESTFGPNTNNQWILPKSLISFGVEGTLQEYDLRECSKLERLSTRLCSLTKLPLLPSPVPPIKILRFDGCPLNKLTAEDIAVFCLLRNLTITSLKAPYIVSIQKCECVRLKQWINKLAELGWLKFHGEIRCAGGKSKTVSKSCSNRSLDHAMYLRKKCLGNDGFFILCTGVTIMLLPVVFVTVVTIRWYRKMYGSQPRAAVPINDSEYDHDSKYSSKSSETEYE